jgi:hypothetical protein
MTWIKLEVHQELCVLCNIPTVYWNYTLNYRGGSYGVSVQNSTLGLGRNQG